MKGKATVGRVRDLLSSGVVGVDGSEGVGVSACRSASSLASASSWSWDDDADAVGRMALEGAVSISVSADSDISDIGERGPAILLRRPGESAPGAVLERFSGLGRGRWRSDGLRSRALLGEGLFVSLFGGKTRRR